MRYLIGLLAVCCVVTPGPAAVRIVGNPEPAVWARYGAALAVAGDDLAIAVREFLTGDVDVVSVSTGLRRYALHSPNAGGGTHFADALTIVGGVLAVGEPRGGTGAGQVHFFDLATGAYLRSATGTAPPPFGLGDFGVALAALDASTLIVGDPTRDLAHVVDVASGAITQTLLDPVPGTDTGFAHYVAAGGGLAVVGATAFDTGGPGRGAVHVFDAATGALVRTIPNPGPTQPGVFGRPLGLVGGELFVHVMPDGGAPPPAPVQVFDPVTGTLLRSIGPTGATGSLGMLGGDLLIGRPGAPAAADTVPSGDVLLLSGSTGAVRATWRLPTPIENAQLGWAVSGGGALVAAGAPGADRGAGVAAAFDVVPCAGPDGAACDDGNPCTTGDACSGGVCSGGVVTCPFCQRCDLVAGCVAKPYPGCRGSSEAGRGSVSIRDGKTPASDALKWTFRKGEELGDGSAGPGDPVAEHDFAVCVYENGAAGTPRLALHAPAGGTCGTKPCWTRKTLFKPDPRVVFRYKDPATTADGLLALTLDLDEGPPGGSLRVTGKGPNLGIGTLGLVPPVVVQGQSENGRCWESIFATPTVGTASRFQARSD